MDVSAHVRISHPIKILGDPLVWMRSSRVHVHGLVEGIVPEEKRIEVSAKASSPAKRHTAGDEVETGSNHGRRNTLQQAKI